MNCGQVGEIGPFRVEWRIANFFSLSEEIGAFYSSPRFYFLNRQWFLRIYPRGFSTDESKNWILLYLQRDDQGLPTFLRYAFGIKKADGTEETIFTKVAIFSKIHPVQGRHYFLERSELLEDSFQLTSSGALTIVCTLWSDVFPSAETVNVVSHLTGSGSRQDDWLHLDAKVIKVVSHETQTEDLTGSDSGEDDWVHLDVKGGAILRKHFQDLLLDGKDHDVTLKVKGQEFKAHKNILRARSPVFSAMFTHNMTENEGGDVCIDDCDPNAFGEFLKYVYVGKLENISPTTATGLHYAADKYDFPDLKETCVKFLKASLTENVLCDVITLALKHGEDELLECAMEFFSKHVVETLMTVEWQRFLTSNPILANELTIKAMKTSNKSTS